MHPSDETLAGLLIGDDTTEADTEHVAQCEVCQQTLAELSHVDLLLRSHTDELTAPDPQAWDVVADQTMPRAAVVKPRWRRPALVAAAVLLFAAGGVLGRLSADRSETVEVTQRATLMSMDGRLARGSAELVRAADHTALRVRARDVTPPADGYVEVWLINTDGKRMVSVGMLPAAAEVTLAVPEDLLAQGYRIVDLSNEAYDDRPAHSGDSLMRGTLA